MLAELRSGEVLTGLSGVNPGRSDNTSALVATAAHGRFNEAARVGRLYSGGLGSLTSLANVLFTVATLGATCTPILGLYNPKNSGAAASVLLVTLNQIITALQVTGCGAMVWATQVDQTLTLGNSGINRNTFQTGGLIKDMSGVALTGLSTNLVVRCGSSLGGGPISNVSTLQTAAGLMPPNAPAVEIVDGAWRVPPGGVLALLATGTPVAISAVGSIMWEETSNV